MTYKFISRVLMLLIVICLCLIVLINCVNMVTYSLSHYNKLYDKFNISREINIDKEELMIATTNLLDYIKGHRDNLDFESVIKGEKEEFFSNRDKLHMIDVKNIFVSIKKLRNYLIVFLIIIIIVIKRSKKLIIDKGRLMTLVAIIGALPFILLITLMLVNFNKYFTIFHEIFFDNDLWLLDPKIDRLVNIFPEEFFAYTAIKIIIYYFIILFVFLLLGILKVRKDKNG